MKDFDETLASMEAGLQIDENALNDCLIQQPELYWKVAKQHAIATSDYDAAKKALADSQAEVDAEIRNIARNRNEKMTVGEIEATITRNPQVEKAARKIISVGHEVALLRALKESFSMRSEALKDLVKLYIASYYEESSQDKAQKNLREERIEKRRKELAKTRIER